MAKKLEIIQFIRRGHLCITCQKKIPGFRPAIALVDEEVVDGRKEKHISYFCNIDCYNVFEVRVMYGAGAALEY